MTVGDHIKSIESIRKTVFVDTNLIIQRQFKEVLFYGQSVITEKEIQIMKEEQEMFFFLAKEHIKAVLFHNRITEKVL